MPAKPTFEFGLVMAGAISAGAYTAGVVDFLIEALDAWEEARRLPDYRGPQHRALLKVMSGASAGGMTSAIAGVALQSVVQPVRNVDAPPPFVLAMAIWEKDRGAARVIVPVLVAVIWLTLLTFAAVEP